MTTRVLWFPVRSLSFWTSTASVVSLVSKKPLVRAIGAFCGLVCGIGGAGVVYERVSVRTGQPLEPVLIVRHINKAEGKSLFLHLVFAAVALYGILKNPH